MRHLRRVERTWDYLGKRDPMWAVLTNRADWDEQQFFATGVEEIAEVLEYTEGIGVSVERGRALDFGCGLGRLTRALGAEFEQVVGVDIAQSMIEAAQRLNSDRPNCEFMRNTRSDLARLESASFDFIYSNITLQHMPWSAAAQYLAEFVRLLRGGGALVFQLPTGVREGQQLPGGVAALRRRARAAVGRVVRLGRSNMEMHCTPRDQVEAWLEQAGGTVVDAKVDERGGRRWAGLRYTVVRADRSRSADPAS